MAMAALAGEAFDTAPPQQPVKLLFIHHSVGEGWLNDGNGDLARALARNNYFVSDTNYGWGPEGIGDRTDIPDWPDWFVGPDAGRVLAAVYGESGVHSNYRRPRPDPGGENTIVMFKSCFPNSSLSGNPDDAPSAKKGLTVGHAKYVYNRLLGYFRSRPDKLFVVITSPPLLDPAFAANARAFDRWLVNDWLRDYPFPNVAVWDFHAVLSDPKNHHRFNGGRVEHIDGNGPATLRYDSDGDEHPSRPGYRKATAEFLPMLNGFYHRWQARQRAETPAPHVSGAGKTREPGSPPGAETGSGSTGLGPPAAPAAPAAAPERPAARATSFDRNVQAGDFTYLGAFRLPLGDDEENSFAYGGAAMTFRPDGDPAGAGDGFSGSLFLTGHPYQLPKGRQVAEIAIPRPAIAKNADALPTAALLQPLSNVTGTTFERFNEMPRVGLQYLAGPAERPKIHIAFGQHLDPGDNGGTHGAFDPLLTAPHFVGPWRLVDRSFYSVTGYLFEIPKDWADRHVAGRVLATGRFRDGGWSGMGPSLIAYRPWDEKGRLAPPDAGLSSVALIQYQSSEEGDDPGRIMQGYQPPDEWEGGAWLTTSTGKSAVLFAGTKAVGKRSWYGYVNTQDPRLPCVAEESSSEAWSCRMADGQACAAPDYQECRDHNYVRGWWTDRFAAQFILYAPQDLVEVAAGRMDADRPQPYARIPIDRYLFLNAGDDPAFGSGAQRRYRIGAVAYDRRDDRLFVIEPLADGAKPVVHVWQVR